MSGPLRNPPLVKARRMYLTWRTPERPLLYALPSKIIATRVVDVIDVSDIEKIRKQAAKAVGLVRYEHKASGTTDLELVDAVLKSLRIAQKRKDSKK